MHKKFTKSTHFMHKKYTFDEKNTHLMHKKYTYNEHLKAGVALQLFLGEKVFSPVF